MTAILKIVKMLCVIACFVQATPLYANQDVIKAAEQGNAFAQSQLGFMYVQGEGVPQDDAQAVSWFLKAAEQGNAAAQTALGVIYEEGKGVPQDYVQAVSWYRKAAEQGDAKGQSLLGFMYALGQGVPKNPVIAYALFNIAGAQGNKDVIEGRDLVLKGLTPDQVARAQALSQELIRQGNFIKALDAFERSARKN